MALVNGPHIFQLIYKRSFNNVTWRLKISMIEFSKYMFWTP